MADLLAIEPEPPGQGVIDYLEHQLERARQGEFSSMAVAFVYRDGSTGSGWTAAPSLATLTGSVAALQAKLVAEMIE